MPKHDLYQQVTDRIVAALDDGVAPWICPWDRSGGRPHNGSSGHVYRGVNTILTGMAGYADARWYTYRQAQAKGGQVRRGEKGTTVIYWAFIEKTDDHAEGAERRTRRIPILRAYTVFNRQQIAWPKTDDPGAEVALDEGVGFEAARDLVVATGADIRHGGVRAYYAPNDDRITLPEPSRFGTPGDYWSTTLHELTHWTGHDSRLARNLGGRFGDEAYAAEELVAELGAAFLCAELSVEGHLQHPEYVGSWIKVLKGDKRAIFTAARLAQEAADFISKAGAVDEEVEPTKKAA